MQRQHRGKHQPRRGAKDFLKQKTFHGSEIVAAIRRVCRMNMFLNNIGETGGANMSRADLTGADLAANQIP